MLVVGALFATTVAALQWPAPQISRRAVACGAVAAVLQPSGGFASDEIISTVLVPGDTSSPLPARAQRVVLHGWVIEEAVVSGQLVGRHTASWYPCLDGSEVIDEALDVRLERGVERLGDRTRERARPTVGWVVVGGG